MKLNEIFQDLPSAERHRTQLKKIQYFPMILAWTLSLLQLMHILLRILHKNSTAGSLNLQLNPCLIRNLKFQNKMQQSECGLIEPVGKVQNLKKPLVLLN